MRLSRILFSYIFYTCVDCIKSKLIATIRNVKANKCIELLGVIHTNIYGSFNPRAMGGHKYLIIFIMIILVMVLSSSFVRILTLWRVSKLNLSSNKGRRSKWFILTKVMSTMVDMMR